MLPYHPSPQIFLSTTSMFELLKGIKTSQLTRRQSFIFWLVVLVISAIVFVFYKLYEKAPTATVNSSNPGVEINHGASNNGQDSRSGSITVTGSGNTVNQNSTVGK